MSLGRVVLSFLFFSPPSCTAANDDAGLGLCLGWDKAKLEVPATLGLAKRSRQTRPERSWGGFGGEGADALQGSKRWRRKQM